MLVCGSHCRSAGYKEHPSGLLLLCAVLAYRRHFINVCGVGTGLSVMLVVHLLSHVRLFAIPWTAARQAPLSSTVLRSLLKLMSIEPVMLSNHLILCCPLLRSFSIFPSIRVFSNESALPIRWPKYWSFSFSMSHSGEYSGYNH